MGSLARAGSEARPGSELRRPAAGRRAVPSTGQNTVLPAHSGLRPPFTTEERICSDTKFQDPLDYIFDDTDDTLLSMQITELYKANQFCH